MGKLLRVLTIFLFVLSGTALTLGILLFNKREELKGRTQKLERNLIALVQNYVEDKQAEKEANTFVGKDTDECTSTVIDNPTLSPFWSSYNLQLEKAELEKMKVDTPDRLAQLMTYYLRDPVETYLLSGKRVVMKDQFGLDRTDGKGTMQEMLDEITQKAASQYQTLNSTRVELKKLREEMITTITELNQRKKTLRDRLAYIVKLEAKIKELEATIEKQKQQIAQLEEEKRGLQEQIAEKDKKITELEEQKIELKATIEELKKEIKRLREISVDKTPDEGRVAVRLEPGFKGKVVAVNKEWNFVVMELTDQCLEELVKFKTAWPPPAELLIKRGGEAKFVTKVRMIQLKKSTKLGIGEILTDWDQEAVKVGDVVFF